MSSGAHTCNRVPPGPLGQTFDHIAERKVHCMSRTIVVSSFLALLSVSTLGVVIGCSQQPQQQAQAQDAEGSAAAQAAQQAAQAAQTAKAKQLALEEATPQLQITEEILPLSIPGHTIGETEGVSMNSKGHLFVYSRTGNRWDRAWRDGRGAVRVRQQSEIRQAVGTGQLCRVIRALRPRR